MTWLGLISSHFQVESLCFKNIKTPLTEKKYNHNTSFDSLNIAEFSHAAIRPTLFRSEKP